MPGQVITFYAYKGGTGRTMALANAAVLLARKSRQDVLMIDWDLEAPGLHRFFDAHVTPSRRGPGLIEFLGDLARTVGGADTPGHDEDATRDAVRSLSIDPYVTPLALENLLLPARR